MDVKQETTSLIAGDKVSGTKVYSPDGEKIGTIHDVMIDKSTGKVAYAVMSFGGFLGIGERYHPLPWSTLRYETDKHGYLVNVTADQLKAAPHFASDEQPDWGRDYETRVHDYYRMPYYWI